MDGIVQNILHKISLYSYKQHTNTFINMINISKTSYFGMLIIVMIRLCEILQCIISHYFIFITNKQILPIEANYFRALFTIK